MDANENYVVRLKQWMEGRGYVVPLGVWCQHTDVHLPYVGRRGAAEREREGDEYDRQSNIKFLL